MCSDTDDLLTTERVGLTLWLIITWRHEHLEQPTAEDLAGEVGITENGMRRTLNKLSRVVPIYAHDGRWHLANVPDEHAQSATVET